MTMKAKMHEILEDKIGFKLQVEEQRERVSMLSTENQSLKDKVVALEQELKQTRLGLKSAKEELKKSEEKTQSFMKMK